MCDTQDHTYLSMWGQLHDDVGQAHMRDDTIQLDDVGVLELAHHH